MKNFTHKIIKTLLLITINCSLNTVLAQAPQKMSYQAVIRNASNTLVANAPIGMRISILQGSATGIEVYKEIYNPNPSTNSNGLVNLEIGTGLPITGTFSTIDWANGTYFVKTETDPSGGTNYTIVGTSQLLSVPYAIYAASSGGSNYPWTSSGINDITNNNTGNVGVGMLNPGTKLQVNGDISILDLVNPTSSLNGRLYTQGDIIAGFYGGLSSNVRAFGKLIGDNGLQIPVNAGVGKILTSDASGNATWQTSNSSFTGTNNQIAKFNGTTIVNSQISDDGTTVKIQPSGYIGFSPNTHKLQIAGSNNSLSIIGNGNDGALGKISFGVNSIGNGIPDSYIEEDFSDALTIYGNQRIAIMSNNVGIGTTTPTTKLEVDGFTKLGTDAPAIKMIELNGLTPSTQGSSVILPFFINANRILSIFTSVSDCPFGCDLFPANFTRFPNYEYQFYFTEITGGVEIFLSASNSSSILSKPVKVFITYKE